MKISPHLSWKRSPPKAPLGICSLRSPDINMVKLVGPHFLENRYKIPTHTLATNYTVCFKWRYRHASLNTFSRERLELQAVHSSNKLRIVVAKYELVM